MLIKRTIDWYSNNSLVKKLYLAFIFLVIIPISILAIIVNQISNQIIIDKAVKSSVQNLDVINSGLQSQIKHVIHLSKIIVSNELVQENLRDKTFDKTKIYEREAVVRTFLDYVIEPGDVVSSAILYRNDGYLLGSGRVSVSAIKDSEMASDMHLKIVKEKYGGVFWRKLHRISYHNNEKSFFSVSLLRAVIDTVSGKIIGVLEINIDEKIISDIYGELGYVSLQHLFISDDQGIVVSSDQPSEINTNINSKEYFTWAISNNHKGKIFKIKDNRYLVTSSSFKPLGWVIMGVIPVEELTQDNRKMTTLIFLIGGICILLTSIASVWLARTVTKPLVKLTRSMSNAGDGDLEVRVDVIGNDEIATLSQSFNRMIERISYLVDQVYTEQKRKREFELLALQAQINPHFLYNTLESVCSLAMMKRDEDVVRMVKALSMFYRIVLSKGRNVITIKEEIENLKHYFTIQQIRYVDKFDYEINIDQNIMDKSILKLSIQPLVENSIYHGLRNKRVKGKITITGVMVEDFVTITVEDNGVGIPDDVLTRIFTEDNLAKNKLSFGLKSVDERINLYFGSKFGLEIKSIQNEGTKIKIILPSGDVSKNGGLV